MRLLHKLLIFVIFHTCLFLLSFGAMTNNILANNNIPDQLFGVTLGKMARIICDTNSESVNVKKITGGVDYEFPINTYFFSTSR